MNGGGLEEKEDVAVAVVVVEGGFLDAAYADGEMVSHVETVLVVVVDVVVNSC